MNMLLLPCGTGDLDREHARMLYLLDSLRRHFSDATLAELIDLFDSHTSREEAELARRNPSELAAHSAEHARIRQNLVGLEALRHAGQTVDEALDQLIGLFLTVLFPSDLEALDPAGAY